MEPVTVQTATADETSLSEVLTTPALGSENSLSEQDYLGTLPEPVRRHPLLDESAWKSLRDSGRSPLIVTDLVTTLATRAEFLVGAWLIDRIVPPGLGGSLLANLQPQMLLEADVVNAGRKRNGVLEPRRSAKTTSLWCVLLGRCYLRPVHMAGFSMLTTAKKTTERFRLDIYGPVSRQWPDPKTRPIKLINSNGFERVEFDNGSVLAILSPEGDAIRSGAYDTLVLDEGGEADPDKWSEVISSVLPSFDTRGPGAQVIVAGTGGNYREGSYFWRVLHDEKAGVLRYGVPDDIDEAQLQTWDTVRPIVDRIHPGLDGLIIPEEDADPIDVLEENFYGLGADLFAREYLGHFGHDSSAATAIPHRTWAKTTGDGPVPEGIKAGALAFAVHPGGLWSSIAVAWHLTDAVDDLAAAAWALDGEDEEREPKVGFKLVHHQTGNDRLPEVLFKLAKQTGLPIIHDDQPQEKAIIQELHARARPRPKATLVRFGDKGVAHTKLMNGLKHGTLVHWPQQPLDAAARVAVTRMAGKTRLLGIPHDDPTADTTGLEAAALAIHGLPSQQQSLSSIVVD